VSVFGFVETPPLSAGAEVVTPADPPQDFGRMRPLAQAGVQGRERLDSRFHGNDGRSPFVLSVLLVAAILPGCNSEVLQKQAEQLKKQDEEIARQRAEINALLATQKVQEQQRRDCNRAFREFFDKAQAASDRDTAIALYREGLALCPDDDVAHYELGKILMDTGQTREAENEFEAALKINPGFVDAKKQLDSIRKSK
jgi:tetratricopeptide (TPR) repeat protein